MKQNNSNNNSEKKVIVAMSGGVDSSVAALLLLDQGWQVRGATMDTGWGQAPEQAAAVCRQLGIPHQVVDVRRDFTSQVMEPFVEAYLNGRTPNPCVECNRRIKFPVFLPLMEEWGGAYLATGHYIRIQQDAGRFVLRQGLDAAKDQSYFLYRLGQDVLSRCVFPLGELTKPQVRQLAAAHNLLSSGQKDSFDVCFLPDGDYRGLLRQRCQLTPGDIVDEAGRVLGRHQGLANYTQGQRRGLEIAVGHPLYVLSLDKQSNRLVVGERDSLYRQEAFSVDNHFQAFETLTGPLPVQVKIRYRSAAAPALLTPAREGRVRITFAQPQWNITPGQSAVFYQDDLLLGGGCLE